MRNDYSDLLREYPEIISADQLYRICKISNETIVAKQWLVEFMSRYMIAHANQLSKKSSQLLKKHIKNR